MDEYFKNMANKNINMKLKVAVCNGDLEKVRTLLSAGANPSFEPPESKPSYPYGGQLLHYACHAEIAKELLINGANVNWRNLNGETPLITAIKYSTGSETLVRELLKQGAYVNETDHRGNTPLNLAVKKGYKKLEVIRELLEYGADINIRNRECRIYDNRCTPLDNAISYPECAELLIKITLIKNFDNNYRKIINLDSYKDYRIYSKLSSYLDDCVCEITKMKTCSVGQSLSLYELITSKDASKVAIYQDDDILQLLSADNYPIYHDIISSKISASLE